jgi:hypothetical protein
VTDALDDGELRARSAAVRAEWRDDEEAWTRAAFERWEHGRTFADIARDCMHRGDIVSLATPFIVLRGVIVAVGSDTVRVVDGDTVTDVHLAASAAIVLRLVESARSGGSRSTDASSTFRARLLDYEMIPVVDLGMFTHGDVLTGGLRVGADQVRVRSSEAIDSFVPRTSIAWVRAAGV